MKATLQNEPTVRLEKEGMQVPRRVCFVCTGNTCRSPMAEAVANHLANAFQNQLPSAVRESFSPALEAFSAGLYPFAGDPISPNAVLALEEAGIEPALGHDYHTHRARALTEEDAGSFDLLIAVSPSHAMELMMRFPFMAQRIVTMPKPISDPFGGDLARYRICLREITEGVKELLFSSEEGENE